MGDQQTSKNFIEEADIFVMTSIFEGLPYSLLEAMSFGVPCVVSNVDGNKDVVHNYENGFSCNTHDEFCEKITLLIENPDLRAKLGLSGQHYVAAHHNITDNIKDLNQLYIKL